MQILPEVPEDKRPSTQRNGSAMWKVTYQSRSMQEIFGVQPPAREQKEGASYAPPITS